MPTMAMGSGISADADVEGGDVVEGGDGGDALSAVSLDGASGRSWLSVSLLRTWAMFLGSMMVGPSCGG